MSPPIHMLTAESCIWCTGVYREEVDIICGPCVEPFKREKETEGDVFSAEEVVEEWAVSVPLLLLLFMRSVFRNKLFVSWQVRVSGSSSRTCVNLVEASTEVAKVEVSESSRRNPSSRTVCRTSPRSEDDAR